MKKRQKKEELQNNFLFLSNEGKIFIIRGDGKERFEVNPTPRPTFKSADIRPYFLRSGEVLKLDEHLYSRNGIYCAKVSIEGEENGKYRYSLIHTFVYNEGLSSKARLLNLEYVERCSNVFIRMNPDGDLGLYCVRGGEEKLLGRSETRGSGGMSLEVTDDGRLIISNGNIIVKCLHSFPPF